MANLSCNPGTLPRSLASGHSPHAVCFTPATLIQSLEGLRQRVLEQLDSLEMLVRQRPALSPNLDLGEALSQSLERKRAALEETERRLKAQAQRQEKEWAGLLSQLEADRRLLAEAWERIEQERTASAGQQVHAQGHSQHRTQGQAHGPQKRASATVAPHDATAAARTAPADPNLDQPQGQEILRQFQTLSSDVRRNAENRRDARDSGRRPES